jgi:uncharacterized OB-fold protein
MTSKYAKPLPRFYSEGSREFYDGCKRRELLIQRCHNCGKFRFPPQLMCSECHSTDSSWVPVSGRGVVATFTVIPGFEPRAVPMFSWPDDNYPINVIIVELPDANGVHIVSNLVECDLEVLRVGLEVEVVFEDVTDTVTLPRFRPVGVEEVSSD